MFTILDLYRRNIVPRGAKKQLVKVTFTAGIALVILLYFASLEDDLVIGNGEYIDITKYRLIEPIIKEDFKLLEKNIYSERIPKIIHQTWREEHVPDKFKLKTSCRYEVFEEMRRNSGCNTLKANIESFVKTNPDFDYYFWTDASARMLIAETHPYLLETFDNYVEPVRKADLLRYVVLYEFGGVYADLDTKCLRPLGRVIKDYACVLSREPDVHAALIFNTDFLVTNSIMFCRRKHPFLLQLMQSLPLFSILHTDIDASGPNYLTLQLNSYMSSHMGLDPLDDDAVHVTSSQYFQNNLDPVRYGQFHRQCRDFSKLNEIGKRGCVSLKLRGFYRQTPKYTFTEHHFFHTGLKVVPAGRYDIKAIVHHVKKYGQV